MRRPDVQGGTGPRLKLDIAKAVASYPSSMGVYRIRDHLATRLQGLQEFGDWERTGGPDRPCDLKRSRMWPRRDMIASGPATGGVGEHV